MATRRLLAGLMHNVGRIYILTRASKHPALIADRLTYNSMVRDWHANVAKAVLENWRVAEEIVDAVTGYEDLDREARGPVTLTDVLSLAVLLEQKRTAAGAGAGRKFHEGTAAACSCSPATATA